MLFLFSLALANSTGKTGVSQTGCGGCHGADASERLTVEFLLPTQVSRGEQINVIATLISTDSAHVAAGLNASVSAGTLAAGSNNKLAGDEITQNGPEALIGGRLAFDFVWTAPEESGEHTLYLAGNAVNLDGSDEGDGWNIGSATITVMGPTGEDSDSSVVGPGDSNQGDSNHEPPPKTEEDPNCGCQSAPNGGGALALGAMMVGVSRRKRDQPM